MLACAIYRFVLAPRAVLPVRYDNVDDYAHYVTFNLTAAIDYILPDWMAHYYGVLQ